MRVKLDENLPRSLKQDLAVHHIEATTAEEEGLLSRPDEEVAAVAAAEGRMLFTLDRRLCDTRLYPPGSHPGLVVFRPRTLGLDSTKEHVLGIVRNHALQDFRGCVVIVESARLRVRRPP